MTETNQNWLFFTVDSLLKQCCQLTVDASMLNQRWNNVVHQLLMCQRWNNDEIMLSINRWCVNVESTMMQRWRCNLTIYQHINVDSTLFQPTVPAGNGPWYGDGGRMGSSYDLNLLVVVVKKRGSLIMTGCNEFGG